MAGFGYQKMGEHVAVHSLNEIFGTKLNLNYKTVDGQAFGAQQANNELHEFSSEETVRYTRHPLAISPVNNNRKSKKSLEIERVINEIIPGYKVLVLLRGLPGSGKSTLAKTILERTIAYNPETVQRHILSTDDFFMRNGVYQYNASQIAEAHGWNHQRAFNVMSKGYSPVIIDNTNTQMWEMKPYASMATDFGYILEILEPDTHWCYNEKELEKRNKHGVPKSSIKNMLDRYEKNLTPLKLLIAYGLQYKLQKPPQYRLQPPIGNASNSSTATANNNTSQKQTIAQSNPNFMEVYNLSKPQPSSTKKVLDCKATPSASVDDILMHTDDSSLLKAPVLTPINQTAKIKQSTSLFENIHAWGIDESALRSWDIVTPLNVNCVENKEPSPILVDDSDDEVAETKDMSTSTDDEDFYLLRNIATMSDSNPAYKVVITCNRDINRNTLLRTQPTIAKKLMIDKSCLTVDYLDDHQVHLDNLTRVFPNITPRTIKYWYEKCHRDFDCTIELLLAETDEVINIIIEEKEPPIDMSIKEKVAVEHSISVDSDTGSSDIECPTTPQVSSKNKRKNNSSSDELQDLKKHIESTITISDDHYSQHLLKVKQCKYGPSTSKGSMSEPILLDTMESNNQAEVSTLLTHTETDDKADSDDLEWEFINPEVSSCSRSVTEQVDQIETIEMNIGNQFVKQLEDRFGDPNLTYPKGFQPVIQIPETLARQLYTFYIESVYQQMDAQNAVMEDLVKEDEEFARKLQDNEGEEEVSTVAHATAQTRSAQTNSRLEPTEIPDIMKEQRELNKRQRDADKWKEDTPDTLAARLTKDKLFKAFPTLDKNTLMEILHAHDNVYKDTVDTLLASTGVESVQGDIDFIRIPPLNEKIVEELWEDHNSCYAIQAQSDTACSAKDYREEANRHLEKRTNLYEKVQQYHQRGMKEVAQYYCGLAAKQTKQYELSNSLAATAFLDEHSKRLEDFNTLDLHFLYVKEAIPHLDIFLDRNINLLRSSSTKNVEYLQIITGRGKNSANGVAKIRPAVIARLKERKIGYNQQNPGLLKIKVTKQLKVTSEL